MDEKESNPLANLAQKYVIEQLTSSNQFINDVLTKVQNSLVEAIPDEKKRIEKVIATFQCPFNSCSSLVGTSSKLIKLPVSVQMRENGQEQKEGIYAISVSENIGIQILEQCCRKIVSIPDNVQLVEARKFETELDCYCTIPKSTHQMELIEQGAKYELVFEKKQLKHLNGNQLNNSMSQKRPTKSTNQVDLNQILGSKSRNFDNRHDDYEPLNPDTTFDPPSSNNFANENALLSQLFSRKSNVETLPDTLPAESPSTSNAWANKDSESVSNLPEFDPLEILTSSTRGRSLFEHLKKHRMDRNGKVRINFVQLLGTYFLNDIRSKLEIPPTAALRRAFIDKVFTCLEEFIKPLPPQEEFSNKMGKGYFDVYLKHQNTKSRQRASQLQSQQQKSGVEDFARNFVEQLDQQPVLSHSNNDDSSNSPLFNDQSSMKSENYDNFAYN